MFARYCIIFAVIHFVNTANPCSTPGGGDGDCKPIDACPSLSSHFKQPLTRQTGELLRRHQCGFAGNKPKVCCPVVDTSTSNNFLPDPLSCGYFTESKIVGGEKTNFEEFPWMALLQYQRKNGSRYFNCGGALISKRYILTAAHCITKDLISVRLGEYDLSTEIDCKRNSLGEDCAPPPVDIPIEDQIVHENYDPNNTNQYYDIALLRLTRETNVTKPICLPSIKEEGKSYVGEKLFVAGWGVTETGSTSPVKLKVQVPMRENTYCESTYRSYNFNLKMMDSQFCAGGERGKDSCRGDSGGPLMTVRSDENKDHQWYVAGVVSFGPMPCGMQNWGGIYTRLGRYTSWILSKLKA